MIDVRVLKGANSIYHRDTESQRIKSIKIAHRVRMWFEIICDADNPRSRETLQQTHGRLCFCGMETAGSSTPQNDSLCESFCSGRNDSAG